MKPVSPEVVRHLQNTTEGKAAIVLSHSLFVFDLIARSGCSLCLPGYPRRSGSAFLHGLEAACCEKNARYEQGWFEEGQRIRGVRGGHESHFRIRFMRPPEITVFHFGESGDRLGYGR